jgi:hypothetical protein
MTRCPRCGKPYNHFPALSRYDNKTLICSPCGTDEAMMDFTGVELYDPNRVEVEED